MLLEEVRHQVQEVAMPLRTVGVAQVAMVEPELVLV